MKYKVYGTQGQGGVLIAEFDTLEEAAEFVDDHVGEMSFLIETPDAQKLQEQTL